MKRQVVGSLMRQIRAISHQIESFFASKKQKFECITFIALIYMIEGMAQHVVIPKLSNYFWQTAVYQLPCIETKSFRIIVAAWLDL